MSALCRQLNLDLLRGDVDVKVDAKPLGKPHQRIHAGVVIPGFQPGDGRLLHLQFPGKCALREAIFCSVFNETESNCTGQRRTFPLLAELWVTEPLLERVAGGCHVCRCHVDPPYSLCFVRRCSASRTAGLKPLGLTSASGPIEPTKKSSAPVRR